MKKIITSLVLGTSILAMSAANAGGYHHHNDFGRALGYTAAAAITVGAVSYLCCSSPSSYERGYQDRARYENARREQAAYDAEMARRAAYYQPTVVYRQPVYVQQPVYIQQRVYREPVYVERVYSQPVYQRAYEYYP